MPLSKELIELANDIRLSGEYPYWPDACNHQQEKGVFVGSTVRGEEKQDVYLYWDGPTFGVCVCVRYGSEASQYQSPGPVDPFIDPKRMIRDVDGSIVPYSKYNGPAIELTKAYIAKHPDYKAKLGL